ncbi:MAG TPA: class II aldolase/adducin family protein [Stellaceae bacterium]|nr:class II aldolase/adducin family protein [Stellaceae bacterium]
MSETDELRERVAEACRVLARLDLTKAATGHVSARVPGTDRVLIRARGPGELGVRYTTGDQVIEVDLDGKLVGEAEEGLAAPIEVFIHTAIYRARPEIGSVIHVHPATVVLFTICNLPLLPLYGAYDPGSLQLLLDGIPTYQRSILVSTPELGDELARTMGSARSCMMRGHGITTAGPSVEEAALSAIQLNDLATINYQARLLGDPMPIPAEEQAAFRRLPLGGERGAAPGRPSGRAAALWRYYRALTDA